MSNIIESKVSTELELLVSELQQVLSGDVTHSEHTQIQLLAKYIIELIRYLNRRHKID